MRIYRVFLLIVSVFVLSPEAYADRAYLISPQHSVSESEDVLELYVGFKQRLATYERKWRQSRKHAEKAGDAIERDAARLDGLHTRAVLLLDVSAQWRGFIEMVNGGKRRIDELERPTSAMLRIWRTHVEGGRRLLKVAGQSADPMELALVSMMLERLAERLLRESSLDEEMRKVSMQLDIQKDELDRQKQLILTEIQRVRTEIGQ